MRKTRCLIGSRPKGAAYGGRRRSNDLNVFHSWRGFPKDGLQRPKRAKGFNFKGSKTHRCSSSNTNIFASCLSLFLRALQKLCMKSKTATWHHGMFNGHLPGQDFSTPVGCAVCALEAVSHAPNRLKLRRMSGICKDLS